MRTPPLWFQLTRYRYLQTCTPSQWYQELSGRREIKALYELRKTQPEIFIQSDDLTDIQSTYEKFFEKLESQRHLQKSLTHAIQIKQAPTNIRRYIEFQIIPLFDLLHWYELNKEDAPTHEELKDWLFPGTEKRVRYIVGDAKKMLKVALLECDALKCLSLENSR